MMTFHPTYKTPIKYIETVGGVVERSLYPPPQGASFPLNIHKNS